MSAIPPLSGDQQTYGERPKVTQVTRSFEIAPVDDPADQGDAVHHLAEGSTSITTFATG
jgi:hypothetical protein